jgi:hypothetical protein
MYDAIAKAKSHFIQGKVFGEGEKDSLYLMAVTKITIDFPKESLKGNVTITPDTVALFMNREVTEESKLPYNVQMGETAGLLMRDDFDQNDSVGVWRLPFLEKLYKLQNHLEQTKGNGNFAEYLLKLASSSSNTGLAALLESVNANKKLITYAKSEEFSSVLKAKVQGSSLTEDQTIRLCAILNLIKYIDAVFAVCPACGSIVSLSWGWCPFHGTAEMLPQVKDLDGDGKLKKEFLEYVKSISRGEPFENFYERQLNSSNKIMVHWTEFLVKR